MVISKEYVLIGIVAVVSVIIVAHGSIKSTSDATIKASQAQANIPSGQWELVLPNDHYLVVAPGQGNYMTVPFKLLGQLDNKELTITLNDPRGVFQLLGADPTDNATVSNLTDKAVNPYQILISDLPAYNKAGDHFTYEGYVYLEQNGQWTVDGSISLTFTIGGIPVTRTIDVKAPVGAGAGGTTLG